MKESLKETFFSPVTMVKKRYISTVLSRSQLESSVKKPQTGHREQLFKVLIMSVSTVYKNYKSKGKKPVQAFFYKVF